MWCRYLNGNFGCVFPAVEWSFCQLLLASHKRARGDWEGRIISSNSTLEERAGHVHSVCRMFRSRPITSFFYVCTFPCFCVLLRLGANLKRACLIFFWRMLLCTSAPNGSWVRWFRKAAQLSPGWEAFTTQCCHLPLPQRARMRLLVEFPPSLLLSSSSFPNHISGRRVHLAVASNRRQSSCKELLWD